MFFFFLIFTFRLKNAGSNTHLDFIMEKQYDLSFIRKKNKSYFSSKVVSVTKIDCGFRLFRLKIFQNKNEIRTSTSSLTDKCERKIIQRCGKPQFKPSSRLNFKKKKKQKLWKMRIAQSLCQCGYTDTQTAQILKNLTFRVYGT